MTEEKELDTEYFYFFPQVFANCGANAGAMLGKLYVYAKDHEGYCFMTTAGMGKRLCCGRRAIEAARDKLVEAGLITYNVVKNEGNFSCHTDVFVNLEHPFLFRSICTKNPYGENIHMDKNATPYVQNVHPICTKNPSPYVQNVQLNIDKRIDRKIDKKNRESTPSQKALYPKSEEECLKLFEPVFEKLCVKYPALATFDVSIQSDKFFSYYTEHDWKTKAGAVKNVSARMRTWLLRELENKPAASTKKQTSLDWAESLVNQADSNHDAVMTDYEVVNDELLLEKRE